MVLSLFFFRPDSALEIYPSFNVCLTSSLTPGSPEDKKNISDSFFVKMNDRAHFFDKNGSLLRTISYGNSLASSSGNGRFYISYSKTGKEIELFNADSERFWKMSSREYPYLSYNGELVLLLNGDQSRVRFSDINGTFVGAKEVSGRLCTVVSFSDRNDFGAVGFLDGTFYFVNKHGDIIYSGRTRQSSKEFTVVKNLALSDNGLFAAIHYGNTEKDYILIVSIADNIISDVLLDKVFPVKTSLHVTADGEVAFLSLNTFELYSSDGDNIDVINIPETRYGTSSIDHLGGFYTVSYRKKTGESLFFFYSKDDGVIFTREFPMETYLVNEISPGTILLRGSDNLYSYTYQL